MVVRPASQYIRAPFEPSDLNVIVALCRTTGEPMERIVAAEHAAPNPFQRVRDIRNRRRNYKSRRIFESVTSNSEVRKLPDFGPYVRCGGKAVKTPLCVPPVQALASDLIERLIPGEEGE
jgi:hypothetical protein